MENLELKQILQHLEKQEEDITAMKNGLSVLIKKNNKENTAEVNNEVIKHIRSFILKHNLIVKQIVSAKASADKVQIYFDGLLSNLPLKTEQHLIFRGKIKWQLFLFVAFLGLVITTSVVSYHNYRNTTDYKKAWNALIEAQSDHAHKEKLTNFLKEHQED
jgi:hypothetical protein